MAKIFFTAQHNLVVTMFYCSSNLFETKANAIVTWVHLRFDTACGLTLYLKQQQNRNSTDSLTVDRSWQISCQPHIPALEDRGKWLALPHSKWLIKWMLCVRGKKDSTLRTLVPLWLASFLLLKSWSGFPAWNGWNSWSREELKSGWQERKAPESATVFSSVVLSGLHNNRLHFLPRPGIPAFSQECLMYSVLQDAGSVLEQQENCRTQAFPEQKPGAKGCCHADSGVHGPAAAREYPLSQWLISPPQCAQGG